MNLNPVIFLGCRVPRYYTYYTKHDIQVLVHLVKLPGIGQMSRSAQCADSEFCTCRCETFDDGLLRYYVVVHAQMPGAATDHLNIQYMYLVPTPDFNVCKPRDHMAYG